MEDPKNSEILAQKKEKLLKRPVDADTKIHLEQFHVLGGHVALLESWSWEKIWATSLILLKEDVGHLSKQEQIDFFIFNQLKRTRDGQITYSNNGDYIIINFDFQVPE